MTGGKKSPDVISKNKPLFDSTLSVSRRPAGAGSMMFDRQPRVGKSLKELIAELQEMELQEVTTDAYVARKRELIDTINQRRATQQGAGVTSTAVKVAVEPAKEGRFDIVRGEIKRNDESGSYTLNEAIKVIQAMPVPPGMEQNLPALITAIGGLKPAEQFNIKDMMEFVADRLTPQGTGGVDPQVLEMKIENERLKTQMLIKETQAKISEDMRMGLAKLGEQLTVLNKPPTDSNAGGSSFQLSEDGKIQIVPGAKLGFQEILLWQMFKDKDRGPGIPITGKDGNIYSLPFESLEGVLKVKHFERDEAREDQKVENTRGAIELARKEVPKALVTLAGILQNMRGPSEAAKQALAEGGWQQPATKPAAAAAETKAPPGPTPPALSSKTCGNCGKVIEFLPNSKMVVCPHCQQPNWLGSPDELLMEHERWQPIVEQIKAESQPKEQAGSVESSAELPKDSPDPKSAELSSPTS